MGRTPSARIDSVRQLLLARVAAARPGERFASNRAIAEQHDISYQTADRLVRELVTAGKLERRPASGTYIPGRRVEFVGVQMIFHPRARRKNSFGARLLRELTARCDRERIDWRMTWADPDASRPVRILGDRYPIIWECPAAVAAAMKLGRPALLLNDRPPPGLDSILIDCVSVDDFAGGACAAQILQRHRPGGVGGVGAKAASSFAILSGPAHDPRSIARVEGFRSVARATVKASADWFYEGGMARAKEVVHAGRDGIFCCNDRLAEAIVRYCRAHDVAPPPVVGFDDAPVAQALGLTTIAIPWSELVSAAIAVTTRRLAGDSAAATAHIIATRPVVRRTASPG